MGEFNFIGEKLLIDQEIKGLYFLCRSSSLVGRVHGFEPHSGKIYFYFLIFVSFKSFMGEEALIRSLD